MPSWTIHKLNNHNTFISIIEKTLDS